MTFARRVTAQTLSDFAPLLRRRHQGATTNAEGSTNGDEGEEANQPAQVDDDLSRAEALFSGQPERYRNPFHRTSSSTAGRQPATRTARTTRAGGAAPLVAVPGQPPSRGVLLWERADLPASSVQRQAGNPTGGLRLVQAGFEDATGARIDQTTYFRNVAFGTLAWGVGSTRPYRQDAHASFHVTLLGVDQGIRDLRISHKPSGEASQNNYTTILHWGDLGQTVYDMNLVGKTVRIYAPASIGSPFVLEVV